MFIVVEFQKSAQNAMSCVVNAYENRADAEERYHDILRYAAKTTLLKHGAIMFTEDSSYVKGEKYGAEQPEE